jgi:hypothetical protein
MGKSVEEGLAQLDLQPGQTYVYESRGKWLVVQVTDLFSPELGPPTIPESDVMYDAWVELPSPDGTLITTSTLEEPALSKPFVVTEDDLKPGDLET